MSTRSGHAPTPAERYAGILAHELRTPVTVIAGYLDLLDDDAILRDPAALRGYLAVVRARAGDLAHLVSELTTFDDLRRGTPAPPLHDGAELFPALVGRLAAGRPARIEAGSDVTDAPVDRARLHVALQALLDNAFTHGTPGGEVTVRATIDEPPPRLVVRVINDGPAIPAALREAIFQPFRQAEDATTRRQSGLGLGLAVARRAAEGAGGVLALEPGGPTTFRLELPLREDALARATRELGERLHLADAQTLRAIQDFRTMQRRADGLAEQLERAYLETVTALATAVEARDGVTGDHVVRVRQSCLLLADAFGLGAEARRHVEFAAVLHDVGKISLPDAILCKPGPLSPAERTMMRRHPNVGRQLLKGISFLAPVADAVAAHHERWDGGGYPDGLAKEAIPLAARLIAVADTYDAMTSDRPYRRALPRQDAISAIIEGRGSQFDPEVANIFLRQLPAA